MASSIPPPKNIWQQFSLHNGHNLPAIGFGTYKITDRDDILRVVDDALRVGYRSFDTAAASGNEVFIGEALKKYLPKYDLVQDDIYVTTKLNNADHGGRQRVLDAFAQTEINLGFTPDLYLIHFLGSAKLDPRDKKKSKGQRHNAWSAMAELYDSGRVNSIGVCNFTVQHLTQLLKEYHSDIPVVNQVEWHPLLHDEALLEYCNKNCIQLQGYHSLGGANNCEKLLKDPVIKEISDDHAVSPSQVLLTWSLQRGVAVIPKSTNAQHINENFNLNITLNTDEVNIIDSFATSSKQNKFAWDSKFIW